MTIDMLEAFVSRAHLEPWPPDVPIDAWSQTDLRTAAVLHADGLSLVAIGTQFGINRSTVANRLRRAGVPTRPARTDVGRQGTVGAGPQRRIQVSAIRCP